MNCGRARGLATFGTFFWFLLCSRPTFALRRKGGKRSQRQVTNDRTSLRWMHQTPVVEVPCRSRKLSFRQIDWWRRIQSTFRMKVLSTVLHETRCWRKRSNCAGTSNGSPHSAVPCLRVARFRRSSNFYPRADRRSFRNSSATKTR
jgi:hypothetical protein